MKTSVSKTMKPDSPLGMAALLGEAVQKRWRQGVPGILVLYDMVSCQYHTAQWSYKSELELPLSLCRFSTIFKH